MFPVCPERSEKKLKGDVLVEERVVMPWPGQAGFLHLDGNTWGRQWQRIEIRNLN